MCLVEGIMLTVKLHVPVCLAFFVVHSCNKSGRIRFNSIYLLLDSALKL